MLASISIACCLIFLLLDASFPFPDALFSLLKFSFLSSFQLHFCLLFGFRVSSSRLRELGNWMCPFVFLFLSALSLSLCARLSLRMFVRVPAPFLFLFPFFLFLSPCFCVSLLYFLSFIVVFFHCFFVL